MIGRPKRGMGAPPAFLVATQGRSGTVSSVRRIRGVGWRILEDENIVEGVGWRRVLCASQCVLWVACGTWGLVADLAFMAS